MQTVSFKKRYVALITIVYCTLHYIPFTTSISVLPVGHYVGILTIYRPACRHYYKATMLPLLPGLLHGSL